MNFAVPPRRLQAEPDPDSNTIERGLLLSTELASFRAYAKQSLPKTLASTPKDVKKALTVALQMTDMVCESIDAIIAKGPTCNAGAFQDTGIYRRPCPCPANRNESNSGKVCFQDGAAAVVDIATFYLQSLGEFNDYANVVIDLVNPAGFTHESDDPLIHRCLLASHALAETYIRALQSRLAPAKYLAAPTHARYAKGNVMDDVVRTAHGPVLGHHQIMTLNCATCSHTGMSPEVAFRSYKENLCWFNDWATAGRGDADVWDAVNTAMTLESGRNEHVKDPEYAWQRRNRIGDDFSRWLARLDHVGKDSSNPSLLHTGVLCIVDEWIRRISVASVCYGSYHFWPSPRTMSLADYAEYVCASIGEMVRGWAIDHDSEASIGEHNLLNWLCKDCATKASCEALGPVNALAARSDNAMRISWGPQTYFYFGLRHQGFRRRVDNILEEEESRTDRPWPKVGVRFIHPICSPIVAGDGLSTIVAKLLGLCGIELLDNDNVQEALRGQDWNCAPRVCIKCEFDGFRAQGFMISVGAARLAARLPSVAKDQFVLLLDTYGFRLFPALQTRLLVQCPCLPRWLADVMSCGYSEAKMHCGQSDCSVLVDATERSAEPTDTLQKPTLEEKKLYEIRLLDQAKMEAAAYAEKTGQWRWLSVVSKPLRV